MSQDTWPNGSYAELADLTARREALRQAAALPGADPRALLEAAFAELDTAAEMLGKLAEAEAAQPTAEPRPGPLNAERTLLRAVFQQAPAPLFVLEQGGTIRRANGRAGELIGTPPGYVTGKPLTAFVDPPSRAAVASQLAAAARTGAARHIPCRLLTQAGTAEVGLTATAITLQEGSQLLVVMAAPPGAIGTDEAGGTGEAADTGGAGPGGAVVRDMARRMDLVTAVTKVLLDNSTFSEAVTLQRCARLLAGEIASWVIVDVERTGRLRRQFVIGPHEELADELAREVRGTDPQPGSVPALVHSAGRSIVMAYAEEPGALGTDADGTPLLLKLGMTSLLSAPIRDGGTSYGVLTLARSAADGRFDIADLGLAEELGEHLGVAIRVDRMFHHRSAVAEALQGSLLPARLPEIPGLELSAVYLPASEGLEVSGDFYDVFQVRDGWAITVGDVCGKGQEAAAMTAAARHAIRVLAHWNPDPADVLAKVSEVIRAGDYEDRFVTAKLAYLRRDGDRVRVELASAGHPGPAVVRPDGQVEMLSGGGLPLGLFPDADPERAELELGRDDLLFFYSDGVTDARSADLQYFEDRLADELAGVAGRSASETTRIIQGLVSSFSHDELRDDMTILVAKVSGLGGSGAGC